MPPSASDAMGQHNKVGGITFGAALADYDVSIISQSTFLINFYKHIFVEIAITMSSIR